MTELAAVFQKTVRGGPCQEVVATGDAVDLGALPVLTCWPQDAGPFITMPLVITKDPATGKTNAGMYRMQEQLAKICGKPGVVIEADQNDPRVYSDAQVETRLAAFVESMKPIDEVRA